MNAVRRVRGGTIGLIVLFVAACGSSAPSASPAGSGYQSPSFAVSTSVGEVVASAEVHPEVDSVVEGKGLDGTDYKLEIPAFALIETTTISIRPLNPGETPIGPLVAGVELGPEGTTFALPATLTITLASGDATGLMPFQYTGSADAATATLGITKSIDAGSVQVWLEHFSGAFVANPADLNIAARQVDPGKFPTYGSPSEQAAWAQDTIAIGKWEIAKGPPAPADFGAPNPVVVGWEIFGRGWSALIDAQTAMGDTKHDALMAMVKSGQLKDAEDVTAGLGVLARKAMERGRDAPPCEPSVTLGETIQPFIDARDEYFKNLITNLDADKTFQQLLTDGKPADLKYMEHLMLIFLGSMRQTQLLGMTSETDDLMSDRVRAWFHTYGLNLVSKNVPSTTADWQMILGVVRQAQLLGDDIVSDARPCIPPPGQTCPPHADLWLGPPVDGTQVAEVPICGPPPPPAPTPIPAEDAPVIDHVTISGHGEFDGLSSDLGSGSDGKNVADISIDMEIRLQSVGGVTQMTIVSGTYTMTGSVTGDCVGSGSESGAMTSVESGEIKNAAGNIKVRPLSLSVNASIPYEETCSSRVENPDQSYSIEKTTAPVSAMLDLSFCDVSSGKGSYTCEGFGSEWSIQFTRG